MIVFFNTVLLVYAALFPIINPVGNAPLLLSLTRNCTEAERRIVARRIALNSFFLLMGSLVVGSHVLEFFGISLPVVRIGGGLVVTAFGWQLLNSGLSADDHNTGTKPISSTSDSCFGPRCPRALLKVPRPRE